jgi:hypothetical protein
LEDLGSGERNHKVRAGKFFPLSPSKNFIQFWASEVWQPFTTRHLSQILSQLPEIDLVGICGRAASQQGFAATKKPSERLRLWPTRLAALSS